MASSHHPITDVGHSIARSLTTAASSKSPLTTKEAIDLFKAAGAVCFDVDSTVITTEGIDEFAASLGVGAKVAALTNEAMGGSMSFGEAFSRRLEIMSPTKFALDEFTASHPAKLTAGVEEFMATIRAGGTDIFLLSGGFTQMIYGVANRLEIPRERVLANTILFNEDGSYAGYDTSAFTSTEGGKARAVQWLLDSHGYGSVAVVGDGATDMEARPPASVFVGFGGNAVRESVRVGCDWWVTDFADATRLLR